MQTVECLKWLKDNNLYELASKTSQSIKKIYTTCLNARGEKILIVGDAGFRDRNVSAVLAGAYYIAAEQLKLDAKLIFQEAKTRGKDADKEVVAGLSELKNESIIILNMSDKLGSINELGKSFRKWVKKKQHRFISAGSLGDIMTENIDVVLNAMDIPYKPLQTQHEEMRKRFSTAKEINVTTDAGTDLYYNINGISPIIVDGNYTTNGSGGNLPAGEIYMPPNGKKVDGKIVIDGSSRTHERTILVKEPIELKVKDGTIESIKGGSEAKELEKTLEWAASIAKNPGGIRRICEFGIGLNPKAQIIGAMVIDDKTLGTAHIGIGSNYWFGGNIYAIIHLDQVFRNPKIYLDGELLRI